MTSDENQSSEIMSTAELRRILWNKAQIFKSSPFADFTRKNKNKNLLSLISSTVKNQKT